jgi:pyrimidine operon attenuation protein/uracil phosphoribosyltransferase
MPGASRIVFKAMKLKSVIMDEDAVRRSMTRITHEIIEKNSGVSGLVLLGIHRRGMPLAEMLRRNILLFEGKDVPIGSIDISLYRDDLTELSDTPSEGSSEIPCDLTGKKVILVDDVIYTGRTVRAAIEAIFDAGRPCSIQLAVLIDRGHRELPIRADFVGKNVPTSSKEAISVQLQSTDEAEQVMLREIKE